MSEFLNNFVVNCEYYFSRKIHKLCENGGTLEIYYELDIGEWKGVF